MIGIKVSLGDPAPGGALEPRYDDESQILTAESSATSDWPFGVDIDGRLVLDLGSDRTLMNFDLHVGKRFWTPDAALGWPGSGRRRSLVFAPETVAAKSFHLSLRISTDPAEKLVRIDIGDTSGGTLVALSDACVAMLADAYLAGFVVRLP